jgi:uncharacterized membrane protein (DUF4010 family)
MAAAYGLGFQLAARGRTSPAEPVSGRAFEPKFAIIFASAFAFMLWLAALLQKMMGPSGTLAPVQAAFAAMLAITANTVVKAVSAAVAGGRAFAIRLCPSLAGMIIVLWVVWFLKDLWTP